MTTFFAWLFSNWFLVLPLVLGFVALVTLLPHAGRRYIPARAGLALAVIALMLTGLLLIRSSDRLALDFFFYVFASIATVSAGAMIVQRNPVYSALNFAIVVLGVAGLFLVKNASFLAAATIIVYTGAIIVTFLFVIMLAQQTGLADYDRRSREGLLGCLAGFILLGALLFVIEKNFPPVASTDELQTALAEAQDLCAPDRFKRTGNEILNRLVVRGKPAEAVMNQQIDRLTFWRDASATRDRSNKLWGDVRTLLAHDKTVEAGPMLASLQALVDDIQEAGDRYTGVLSAQDPKAGGPHQSTLSHYRTQPKRLKTAPVAEDSTVSNEQLLEVPKTDHVNDLGRTLFGDYLYAVELAGTLLLIATLAAILIAQQHQRRKEALA
jgi:NADH-quinone oxidoreductase subunit J